MSYQLAWCDEVKASKIESSADLNKLKSDRRYSRFALLELMPKLSANKLLDLKSDRFFLHNKFVSLSHTNQFAIAAISEKIIGVDVESKDRVFDERVIEKVLGAKNDHFKGVSGWVTLEALYKAWCVVLLQKNMSTPWSLKNVKIAHCGDHYTLSEGDIQMKMIVRHEVLKNKFIAAIAECI